jgi:hypothetical protein
MTKRTRIGIITVAASLLGSLLFLQPLVVGVAKSAARERGWTIEVRKVRPGLHGLWLKQLRALRSNVPDFELKLQAVMIPWANLFSQSRVVVEGGTITLPERLESLQDSLTQSQPASGMAVKSHHWHSHVSGLTVIWRAEPSTKAVTYAWGVAGEVNFDATHLKIDRIEGAYKLLHGVFVGVVMQLDRGSNHWELDKVRIEQAMIELQTTRDPVPPKAKSASLRHGANISLSASPSGGSSPIGTFPRDAIERFVEVMASVQRSTQGFREIVAHRFMPLASLEVQQLGFRWHHGEQKLDIGPLQAQALRESDRLKISAEQRGTFGEERRYVELRIPTTPSKIELNTEIGFVSLQALGVKESDFGLTHVDSSKLRLSVQIAIDELASKASLAAAGEIIDVNLQQPWLAPRVVEGIRGAFSGSGVVSWQGEYALKVSDFVVSLDRARLEISADLRRTNNETKANVQLAVPLAACEDLIESLPRGLAPLAAQLRLDGTLALRAGIQFDTAHPERTDATWELANGCRVKEASPLVAPDRFREPFILEVPDERGSIIQRAFGPGTASWVPLAAMSGHLPNAILVCEDGRFFHHNGFDSQAIRSSIRDNLLRGRFMRGASTVSMQLAKNLYLRREKTFSRKLQEAALTLLLEQSFSKTEILELYLNVVELGPGVYGVGEASRFYFGTTAAALSPGQAFYLASILPNPKVLHFTTEGRVFPAYMKLLRKLMTIARARHYLSDEELHSALDEDLRFGISGESPQPANTGVMGTEDYSMDDSHDQIDR